jgi:hypothetical protein
MSELWPHAAAAQGWDPRDRDRRLAVINAVLAQHPHPTRRRIIESANDLDSNTDYTLVKNRMLLLADSLTGALEDGDLKMNALRQRREVLRRLVKNLAEKFEEIDPQHGIRNTQHAERYLLKIIRHTTARAGFEPENFPRAPFEKILMALDQPTLDHLIITLKTRLRSKQAKMKPLPNNNKPKQ